MTPRIKIAPSILAADFAHLGEQVREVADAGADYIHIDAMDGQFVPNITLGPLIAEAVHRSTRVPIDLHAMILEPERQVRAFKDAGVSLLTVHVESCVHLHRVLQEIRAAGMRAGVALNPATPLETVRWVLPDVDLLLIMSINPGWGGQKFLPLSLSKIREARRLLEELNPSAELEVDGGIDVVTAPEAVAAGVTVLVAGTAIYGHPDGIPAAMMKLRSAAQSALR